MWRPANIRFVHLDSPVSNMFDACMRTTLAQRVVSIVSSVFDQTCFKAIKHSIKNLTYFFCPRVWWAMFWSFGQPRIKHVWCGHAYHACSVGCINVFGDQTPSNIVWWPNILPFGHLVWCCLIVYDRISSCLIKFEGHQTFDQKRKTFLLFACLMGDVLFIWTAAYQTFFMRACVPRLLSGLYRLFHACLVVTKQCLMVFGRQTFIVFPGPKHVDWLGHFCFRDSCWRR